MHKTKRFLVRRFHSGKTLGWTVELIVPTRIVLTLSVPAPGLQETPATLMHMHICMCTFFLIEKINRCAFCANSAARKGSILDPSWELLLPIYAPKQIQEHGKFNFPFSFPFWQQFHRTFVRRSTKTLYGNLDGAKLRPIPIQKCLTRIRREYHILS